MSIWIRSFLMEPLVTSANDLAQRAKQRFRVDSVPDVQGGYLLRYHEAPLKFIRADHWTAGSAAGEIAEVLEDGPTLPDSVRPTLRTCTESFAFCLNASDVSGMGWPICFNMAMHLGARCGGVIDADGVGWEPRSCRVLS